jgi:uncharacterized membrane protein
LNWGVFLAAFAGSSVELVEVLAVVLVVGRVSGWRNALVGAGGAIGLVGLVALVAGSSLALVPIRLLEVLAGAGLLAFGGWWALSVIRYYGGGARRKDDEDEEVRLTRGLAGGGARTGWDPIALAVAFKGSLIESLEIAIIVVGLGLAAGDWPEAVGGAVIAAVGLTALAVPLRGALERIPVKPTKFVASALLLGFGTYWLGEGAGLDWPGGALVILGLVLLWGLLITAGSALLRSRP